MSTDRASALPPGVDGVEIKVKKNRVLHLYGPMDGTEEVEPDD